MGGFGAAVLEVLARGGVQLPVRVLGTPDRIIEHGNPKQVLGELGLDSPGIERAARELLGA